MGLDTKTYWLTDRQSQCDFDFDYRTLVGSEGSSFGTPACRDMSPGAKELYWAESSELAVAEYWQEST
jgi:hypothetical protein